MSTTVLGRDPFSSSTPSRRADPRAGDDGEATAEAPETAPEQPEEAAGARRAASTRKARIASASRAAMHGVVREARGAKKARARRAQQGAETEAPAVELDAARLMELGDEIDLFGRDPEFVDRVKPVLDFLYHEYFRVSLKNTSAVPDAGRAIIVANHAGTLPFDGLMLMTALRLEHARHRTARPLIEDFPWHLPYVGLLLRHLGCVRADQENAERLLGDEQVVAVFPEGVKGIGKLYRDRYKLQRFGRGGFVKLAMRTGAPIIPAAIVGAEEIFPLVGKITWLVRTLGIPYFPITPTFPWLGALGLLPFPSKWSIELGDPIDMSSYGPEAAGDLILVNRVTEQVRQRISEMLGNALTDRQSVLFG